MPPYLPRVDVRWFPEDITHEDRRRRFPEDLTVQTLIDRISLPTARFTLKSAVRVLVPFASGTHTKLRTHYQNHNARPESAHFARKTIVRPN